MSKAHIKTHEISSLKKRADFLRVRKIGRKWVSKSFILQISPNEGVNQRFGLVVTKKIYKLAVDRNRVKRRLREAILSTLPFNAIDNYDYVFIARREAISIPYKELEKDIMWCLKKTDALENLENKEL